MKKIMMLIAAATIAASVQASAFNWKTSATGKIYSAGTTTTLASGTAYIYDSAAVSQQAVLDAFIADSTIKAGYLDSASVSAGGITAKADTFSWGSAGETLNAYIAVIDGDNIFISGTASGAADAVSTTTLSFNAKTASQAALSTATSFSAGGWYAGSTPGGAPEPTSGLLLLLGMAGLALKRKVA